jgi:hypothetical protein
MGVNSPLMELVMMANKTNTAVSVIMVPPTAIVTAGFFVTPILLAIGYATNVCVENILATIKEAMGDKCRKYKHTGKPTIRGIKKVRAPKTMLLFLFLIAALKSNSRPAKNMI